MTIYIDYVLIKSRNHNLFKLCKYVRMDFSYMKVKYQ